jgi:hypothetical protein
VMPPPYLVLFVAGAAGDVHAEALRAVARDVPGAGFFDDPAGGEERTVGAYLRLDTAPESSRHALVGAVAIVSEQLGARVEVQVAERVLGHLEGGRPDAALAAALADL